MSDAHPPRIALASCADYPKGLGGETLLPDALARRGAEATWAVWNDPAVDWFAFDVVVVRCAWDYADHLDAFRAWTNTVAMASTLVNSPRIILGNLHRGYLADMGDDAVPTTVVPAGMTVDLAVLGWAAVVVKPALGVGGIGVVRAAGQRDLDVLTLDTDGPVDVIVQPDLDADGPDGEVSVVCLDGEPSHAVRTKPVVGEVAIGEHVAGAAEAVPLAPEVAATARRAVAGLPLPAQVARVDLVHDGDRVLVAEMDLVAPYLWLELVPEAADRLADVLVDLARPRPRPHRRGRS